MALSFGRRGTGGDGGNINVVYLEGAQSGHASPANNSLTNLDFHTDPWQIGGKSTGKAEIAYHVPISQTWTGHSTSTTTYEVYVEARVSDSASGPYTIVSGDTGVVDNNLLSTETSYTSGQSDKITISGAVAFDLSSLASSLSDGKFVQFSLSVKIDATSAANTRRVEGASITFTSYGNGFGVPPDGFISTSQLADGSVTNPKLATNAVTGDKIGDGEVDTDQLADDSVTSVKIEDGAVTSSKINDGAVGANKILDGSINSSKIGSAQVGTNQLADGSITNAKLNASFNLPIPDDSISTDKIQDRAVNGDKIHDRTITTEKYALGSIGSNQIADGGVESSNISDGAVTSSKIQSGSVDNTKLASNSVDSSKIQNATIQPGDLSGITNPSSDAGKAVIISDDGTSFVAKRGGAGGGITEVVPSDMKGVTGGSGDGDKVIKTNSTGDQFSAGIVNPSNIGITGGGNDADKFVRINDGGDGFNATFPISPGDLGLVENVSESGRIIGYDTTGAGFKSFTAHSAGADPTLENITGILNTTKGGTGINATDINDLRAKLGITSGVGDDVLAYQAHADTQPVNSIQRVDGSTDSLPSGITYGVLVRVGSDQYVVNLRDGKQWTRRITDNNDGVWTEPVNDTTLTEISTESQFRTFGEGDRAWTNSTTFGPRYTNGQSAGKVIVGRNGDYLVAINRNNMWYAQRPTDSTWTSIPWVWEESQGPVPAGLKYEGGEQDENKIPPGDDAVLSGKSGIDGENYISVMVDHQLVGSSSRYVAYFINDDAGQTIQTAQNTRGYVLGDWSRTQLDEEGISDDVVLNDRVRDKPVFDGLVPAVDTLTFPGYIFKTSGTPENGDILYVAHSRSLQIKPNPVDSHMDHLLEPGYEVELQKDPSNYIRGVVFSVTPLVGSDEFNAVLRDADLVTLGTISHGDTISVISRGTALRKNDTIKPENLGINSSADLADKVVGFNASGDRFVAVEQTGGDGGGGTPGDNSIGPDQLRTGAVTTPKVATGAITGAKISSGAVGHTKLTTDAVQPENLDGLANNVANAGKAVVIDDDGTGFTTGDLGDDLDVSTININDLANILRTTKGGTGLNASNIDDLRDKLGIGSTDTYHELLYQSDLDTQKANTLNRVDSSSVMIPTGMSDGVVSRVGNDQFAQDSETGKTWRRSMTDTSGEWGSAQSVSISQLSTGSQFRVLTDTGIGYTTNSTWLPNYPDNRQPSKVLVGRQGDYLFAVDRHNFWWSERPDDDIANGDPEWTSLTWNWESTSTVPRGLIYSGGESDEEHIQVGMSAVLADKSGIDGTNAVYVIVIHTINNAKTQSTYAGYFLDDDNSETTYASTRTRNYHHGDWSRTRLDIDGISTDIFVPDTDAGGNERPAFVGVVPAISDLHFGGYTYKTALAGISEGDVAYLDSTRVIWLYQKPEDMHLPTLFDIDYELSIHKDDDNYIRGVFDLVQSPVELPGGVTLIGAQLRSDDLKKVGTLTSGDDVSIRGHKAVLTKTDVIEPINLGLAHSSDNQSKFVKLNATSSGFEVENVVSEIADGAIDTENIADDAITAELIEDGAVGSDALATDAVTGIKIKNLAVGTSKIAAGAVTGAKIPADAIGNEHIKENAIQAAQIDDDAVGNSAIADGAIQNAQIDDEAVEAAQIKNSAVETAKIEDGAVTHDKLADDAVHSENIDDGAIINALIAADAVDTAEIKNDAVTPPKIAGVATGADEAGKSVILNSSGDGFTTRLISGDGSGSGAAAVLRLGEGSQSNDTTYTYTSTDTGIQYEDEDFFTESWQVSNRTSGKAVFYYRSNIVATISQGENIGAVLNIRWADNAAMTENASNWTSANLFNGNNTIFYEQIPHADTNLEKAYIYALPFELSDLHASATDGKYIQFQVSHRFSNVSTNASYVVKARRVYGFEVIGGGAGGDIGEGAITHDKLAADAVEADNIANGAVENAALASDAVGSDNIATGAVGENELAGDAVTGAKIKDNAVANEHITQNAVDTAQIKADAVTQAKMANDSIGAPELINGSVDTIALAAGAVTGAKIEHNAVGNDHIAENAVGTEQIADDSVTGDKIKNESVDSEHIVDGAIDADHLSSNSVTSGKINSGAVTHEKLATDAVEEDNIKDNAVTQNKIADDAVGSGQIDDGAVLESSIANDAVTPTKVKGVETGGDESGKVVILDSAGTGFTTVDQSSLVSGGVPGNNTITTAMLQDGSVTSAKLGNTSYNYTTTLTGYGYDSISPLSAGRISVDENNNIDIWWADSDHDTKRNAIVGKALRITDSAGTYKEGVISKVTRFTNFDDYDIKFLYNSGTLLTSGEWSISIGDLVGGVDVGSMGTSVIESYAMRPGAIDNNIKSTLNSTYNSNKVSTYTDPGFSAITITPSRIAINASTNDRPALDGLSVGDSIFVTDGSGNEYSGDITTATINFNLRIFDLANVTGYSDIQHNSTCTISYFDTPIVDGVIRTKKIDDGAVTTSKVASSAITNAKLGSSSISPDKVAGLTTGGSAGGWSIALNSQGNAFVSQPYPQGSGGGGGTPSDGSISTVKLANKAVTSPKLGDGAVRGDLGNTGRTSTSTYTRTVGVNQDLGHVNINATDIGLHWRTNDSSLKSEWEKVGAEIEVEDSSGNIMRGTVVSFPGTGSDPRYTLTLVTGYSGLNSTGQFTLRSVASETTKVAPAAINALNIADGAITGDKFGDKSITGAKLADGAITLSTTNSAATSTQTYVRSSNASPNDGEVTPSNTVIYVNWRSNDTAIKGLWDKSGAHINLVDTSGNIMSARVKYAVDSSAVSAYYITDAQGLSGLVANSQLSLRVVASTQVINDGAVTGSQIADKNITGGKIVDGAITPALLSGITSANTGQVITVNSTGTGFTPSSSAGSVPNNSVSTIKIQDDAVTLDKMAANSVDTDQIVNGAVEADQIAANAVTNDKIQNGAVDTNQLAADAVTNSKIGSLAVGTTEIADDAITPSKVGGLTTGPDAGGYAIALSDDGSTFVSKVFPQSSGGGGVIVTDTELFKHVTLSSNRTLSSTASAILVTPTIQIENNKVVDIRAVFSATNTSTSDIPMAFSGKVQYSSGTTSGFTPSTWTDISSNAEIIKFKQSSVDKSVEVARNDSASAQTSGPSDAPVNTQHKHGYFDSNTTALTDTNTILPLTDINTAGELFFAGNSSSSKYYKFRLTAVLDDSVSSVRLNTGRTLFSVELKNTITTTKIPDGSITTIKLAANAVTNDRLADNSVSNSKIENSTIDIGKIASLYKVLNNGYTFQSNVASGIDDGKFSYVDDGTTGQISFNVKTDDLSAISDFVVGNVVVLYKDDSKYVVGRQTTIAQTLEDDSTEGAFTVDELKKVGSNFENGDSVVLYYGSKSQPGGIITVDITGEPVDDVVTPETFNIISGSTASNQVISVDGDGTGIVGVPPVSLGMVKATILMRQSWSGNGQSLDNVGSTRVVIPNRQTGTWKIANKSTDWARVNATGLYYFDSIPAQPICADLELWVQWKSGTESFQTWNTGNTRVARVDMGFGPGGSNDGLQVVKLYAGGANGTNSHVDCALSTGDKFFKLSELPSDIADGDDIRFNVGFKNQSPSPTYDVRNFYMTIDILDGGRIYANY